MILYPFPLRLSTVFCGFFAEKLRFNRKIEIVDNMQAFMPLSAGNGMSNCGKTGRNGAKLWITFFKTFVRNCRETPKSTVCGHIFPHISPDGRFREILSGKREHPERVRDADDDAPARPDGLHRRAVFAAAAVCVAHANRAGGVRDVKFLPCPLP